MRKTNEVCNLWTVPGISQASSNQCCCSKLPSQKIRNKVDDFMKNKLKVNFLFIFYYL